jgi:hypothetical protein
MVMVMAITTVIIGREVDQDSEWDQVVSTITIRVRTSIPSISSVPSWDLMWETCNADRIVSSSNTEGNNSSSSSREGSRTPSKLRDRPSS